MEYKFYHYSMNSFISLTLEKFIYFIQLYNYTMARKNITLSIEESIIKKLKKKAIDKDTNISSMIEDWSNDL